MAHIVILTLLILGAVFQGEALQCYECENCESVSSSHLKTCGEEETTTAGTATEISTTPASGGNGNEASGNGFFDDAKFAQEDIAVPFAETYICASASIEVINNGDQNNVTTMSSRLCLEAGQLSTVCQSLGALEAKSVRVHVCTTDGCNAATKTSATVSVALILAFVTQSVLSK